MKTYYRKSFNRTALLGVLVLVALLVASGAGLAQDQCIAPPDGLVGWWPGDGDTTDIGGAVNDNGTNEGDVPFVAGYDDQAFDFSGTSGQSVTVGNPSTELMPDSISVDAWVKFNGNPFSARYIVGKGGLYCSHASYAIYTAQAACGGNLAFYVARNGSTQFGNSAPLSDLVDPKSDGAIVCASVDGTNINGNNIFTDGQWHFLVGTYDENEGVTRLYVDGVLVGDSNTSGGNYPTQTPAVAIYDVSLEGVSISTDDLTIGNYALPSYCELPFDGDVDEVEIFNRALTEAEIELLYTNGKCKGVEPSIVKDQMDGPDVVGIYTTSATAFSFEITYTNDAQAFDVRILDTVPAEFTVTSLNVTDGNFSSFATGKGNKSSATRIEWDILAETDCSAGCTLTVTVETVEGQGGKGVYKPTSCGTLSLNNGATAYEVDTTGEIKLEMNLDSGILEPVIVLGPSNPLEVEAVGDQSAGATKPCAPENLSLSLEAALDGTKNLLLDWDDNAEADAIAYYNVYRSINDGRFKVIAMPEVSMYEDTNLKPGKYCYQVKAEFFDGSEGNEAGEICETIPEPVL